LFGSLEGKEEKISEKKDVASLACFCALKPTNLNFTFFKSFVCEFEGKEKIKLSKNKVWASRKY